MADRHFGDAYGGNAAENYERFFVPAIGRPVAADLVRRARIRAGERVLDVACGTGIVARLAAGEAGPNGKVAALDVNPGMIAVGRAATGAETSIEWHEADAQSMPLPDEEFDVVLCQMGLQFMPDRERALREMHRVTAPEGRVLVNMPGPPGPAFAVLAEAMANQIAPEAAGFVQRVFSLHDADEIRQLMSSVGFDEVRVEAETATLRLPPPKEFLWQYVSSTPLAALVATADEDARAALEREVISGWRELEEDGAMATRQRVVVASGRK